MDTLPDQDALELEKALQLAKKEAKSQKAKKKTVDLAAFLNEIPPLPAFKPIHCPKRELLLHLSALPIDTAEWTSRAIFRLLFPDSYYELIAENTNKYASLH